MSQEINAGLQLDNTQPFYSEVASWCNNNNCFIEKIGNNLYKVKEIIIPPKTLEELQAEKIAELKANCQNYILSIYPIYKQLNIINPLSYYNNEDKVSMNTFIDNQRQICSSKEEEINNSTLKTIKNISITFED